MPTAIVPATERPPLRQVADYVVLPLQMPSLPSFPHPTTHYIYLKPHSPKLPDPDSPRSLFVANVPIDASLVHFRALFASEALGAARIADVDFPASPTSKAKHTPTRAPQQQQNKKRKRPDTDPFASLPLPATWPSQLHPSGSSAVLTFVDAASANNALKAARRASRKHSPIPWPHALPTAPPLGSARYTAHLALRYPDPSTLESAADAYMTAFGEREAHAARASMRARTEPDADGFVTVTRGARVGPARAAEAQDVLDRAGERARKKSESMHDFYRFQVREKRKAEAGELVRRFQEGRQRVGALRAAVPE